MRRRITFFVWVLAGHAADSCHRSTRFLLRRRRRHDRLDPSRGRRLPGGSGRQQWQRPRPTPLGRREINWDGGGGVFATTLPVTPFNVFLNTRGAQFTTPGTGLTQAPPSADPVAFPPGGLAGLNPTYATTFGTFSPERLFAPVGSNLTDSLFFLPGSNGGVPATVSGFGAVFTDVDLLGHHEFEFFNAAGDLHSFVNRARFPMKPLVPRRGLQCR